MSQPNPNHMLHGPDRLGQEGRCLWGWAQPRSPRHRPIIRYKVQRSLLPAYIRNTTSLQRNAVVSETHSSISSSALHFHNRLKMFSPYILGAFLASVLGFLLLYDLREKERKIKRHRRADGLVTSSSGIGECPQDDGFGTDVIIVGAGVAGSALAHTLGKVSLCSILVLVAPLHVLF